jgi:hypothetical protein
MPHVNDNVKLFCTIICTSDKLVGKRKSTFFSLFFIQVNKINWFIGKNFSISQCKFRLLLVCICIVLTAMIIKKRRIYLTIDGKYNSTL